MDWISPENPNEKIRVNPFEGSGTVIFPQNHGDLINNEINDDINSIDDNKGGLISVFHFDSNLPKNAHNYYHLLSSFIVLRMVFCTYRISLNKVRGFYDLFRWGG